jgi:hypothetical protein
MRMDIVGRGGIEIAMRGGIGDIAVGRETARGRGRSTGSLNGRRAGIRASKL